MSTIVITKFEKESDVQFVAEFIRKLRTNAKVIRGKNWEDACMAEIMMKG